ncbi:MAG TPA: phosphatase PAP2-related protein [Cyclobacteriaceae bacterium]|jgi:hypothetical protein|nr:phosphatase PAP2-related protein [Cyclobacteriaceae bacterium]
MWTDWRAAFKSTRFTIHFTLAVLGIIAFAATLPYFFNEILLPKPGVQLNDPILNFFTPRDWSIAIFLLLYSITVISVLININKPNTILLMFQMYAVVNLMRMTSLYLFTLEAPDGTIPLRDPFLTVFAYGKEVYVKDLFFSGHVSTLCILFLIEKRKMMKQVILGLTLVVALLLAWQRVHYTLDMLAAPLISWLVFRFFAWFNSRLKIYPV